MKHSPVTLYSRQGCRDSDRVRAWLVKHNIPFQERNVSQDPSAMQALAAQEIFGTPLVVAEAGTVFGYRPNELAKLLIAPPKFDRSVAPDTPA